MVDETVNLKEGAMDGALQVTYYHKNAGRQVKVFQASFSIGRESSCAILLTEEMVSKRHVEIYRNKEGWWIRDLGSRNGTLLNGERIQHALISRPSELQITRQGPILWLEILGQKTPTPQSVTTLPGMSVTQIVKKYAGSTSRESTGLESLILHQAFARVKKTESKRTRKVIAVSVFLLFMVGSVAVYQNLKLKKLTRLGTEIFYAMKAMEVQVENLLEKTAITEDNATTKELAQKRRQLEKMQERYQSYVEEIGIFSKYKNEVDQTIFRMARLFGECELNVPKTFSEEVKKYIKKWQTTNRLAEAMDRIKTNNYASLVFRTMVENQLPPQFLYISLQESDFKPKAVGPKTRFGIAKGFWQMIPSTAAQYGLKTGPLVELAKFDPRDERFDFTKSTQAAVKYLKYIYNTEAQASGLLVIASYNWGHNNIRKSIRKLPENPRERNFWNLLKTVRIPKETYNYVFYIFSAAVIGENPGLFNFTFSNPLADLEEA